MLVLTESDLRSLLPPVEWRRAFRRLREPGSEILLFVCSVDRLYLGCLPLYEDKSPDFDRFSPSQTYMNLYSDLPETKLLPCPACGQDPSVVRMENTGGKISVFSS